MATYHFKSTEELAEFFTECALEVDELVKRLERNGDLKNKTLRISMAERAVWLSAAAIVKNCEINHD